MSEKISRAELDQIAGMPSLYRCGWLDAREGGWKFDVAAFPRFRTWTCTGLDGRITQRTIGGRT